MPFKFSLISLFLGFVSSSYSTQHNVRNKLQKTPPAPSILDNSKIRGHLIRQDADLSTVLASSYEKCRAWFSRHKKSKTAEPVQRSRDIVSSQAAACPQAILSVITKTHTVLDTPPKPPHTSESTSDRRDSGLEQAKYSCVAIEDASADHIEESVSCATENTAPILVAARLNDPEEARPVSKANELLAPNSPTASCVCNEDHLAPIVPVTVNTESQPGKAASPSGRNSDEEIDNGTSSTTKSNGLRSTTVMSDSCESLNISRSDWEPLRALPHLRFYKILSQHVGGSVETAEDDYQYGKEFEGGYNYVRIYNLLTGPNAGAYVVKVPSVGTALRWQKEDGYMLRSEFGTIKFIRERTKCPVPEVIAYEDTLDNDLGAPYILMKACTGVRAVEV